MHQFTSIADAQAKIDAWRIDYNQRRSPGSLGHLRPASTPSNGRYHRPLKPRFSSRICRVSGPTSSRWQVSGTYEYQPRALLTWNNLFFNGELKDIPKDNPEIALRPDGTFDTTKTWFNIDAGFERGSADQPAGFQKRAFVFRVPDVRVFDRSYLHANLQRTFD